MVEPVKPSRAELQTITGTNHRMLRAFEGLFQRVGQELPSEIGDVSSSLDLRGQALDVTGYEALRDLRGLRDNRFIFVGDKFDLPAASNGIIQLEDRVTYYITKEVDLTGDRIVAGQSSVILGASSENSKIKSTGLTNAALITSEWTLPIRHITFEAQRIFDLDAAANPSQAIDWYGVNLQNTSDIGRIANYSNFIAYSMAFLGASGLVFDGTFGTVGFGNTLFVGTSPGTIITVPQTCTITRRLRITYSSFVVFGSGVGLDVSPLMSIPVEGYILDTANFSGGGSYKIGLSNEDNQSLFVNCVGIDNTASVANYYMNNNSTATDIVTVNTPVKVNGATTEDPITQRFTHTTNRATYEGAVTRKFEVMTNLTFTNMTADQCAIYIAKNGIVIPQSAALTTANVANRGENVVSSGIVEMSSGDFMEIFIENRSGNRDVTVTDMNVNIKQIN